MSSAPCKYLSWDSEFFGYRIARVTMDQVTSEDVAAIDTWCAEQKIDCLYFLADATHPQTTAAIEANGYHLHDIRVTLDIPLRTPILFPEYPSDWQFRLATADDVDALRRMSRDTFRDSRFYHDPRFSNQQADDLYDKWIEKSILGELANVTQTVVIDGQPAAYVTCILDRDQKEGEIGLVGVASHLRGQQLGYHLTQSALAYFQSEGMQRVHVVTQGRNIAAQRLYQKCGFRTTAIALWYHKWFT